MKWRKVYYVGDETPYHLFNEELNFSTEFFGFNI